MPNIDINCDMGESFGLWNMGNDEDVMPFVTSANIACGFHAGDPETMLKTIRLAIANNVEIGAHPGLPDLQGFGRRTMVMTNEEIYGLLVYQIGALQAFAKTQGRKLHHVKTHGALYNMSVLDFNIALAVAKAVHDVDSSLQMYVANANMVNAGLEYGMNVKFEVYADRSYQDDGTLTPRSQPQALIEDLDKAVRQVKSMVIDGTVTALSGKSVPIKADTLCIHGDQPGAAIFARQIHAALRAEGITINST